MTTLGIYPVITALAITTEPLLHGLPLPVRLLQLSREVVLAGQLWALASASEVWPVRVEFGVCGDVEDLAQGGAAFVARPAVFTAFEFPDPTSVDMFAGGFTCRVGSPE